MGPINVLPYHSLTALCKLLSKLEFAHNLSKVIQVIAFFAQNQTRLNFHQDFEANHHFEA